MEETSSKKFIKSGTDNKTIQSGLNLMEKNSTIHNRHEGTWKAIQRLFEGAFTVNNPTGTRKITSKLLLQVLWKVVNKMKIPDFKIYKAGPFKLQTNPKDVEQEAGKRDLMEQIVTAGVSTVMKEGKFVQCMRDKGGAFYKSGLFGDAHIQIGYDEGNGNYPITFRVASLSDVYMNNQCTDIRDAAGGLSAEEMVLIYRYTMKEFDNEFPDMKGKVAPGEIPRTSKERKQLEKTWLQTTYDEDDTIEVGYRIGLDKKMAVFAGSASTEVRDFSGEDFPYMMDGKPFMPVLHFKFFPSSEGYYNYGIGHMLYDLAILTAQMDNMAYNHAGDNIFPITFVNSPTKNSSKLFNEILKAHEMRAAGGKGYVVSENPLGQGAGVTVEAFQSPPITGEWERAFSRLEQQIERMGFKLDMPDLGANPNQMSIMAEQEATDAPIKQIIEFNASEFEMAVNMTMSAMREHIEDDDETPINSTVDIEAGDGNIPMRGFPLGWIAKELRDNKYFVVVNSRDGTIPSNVMEQAQISKTMSTLAPGTPAWNKMSLKQARLNGQNLSKEDLMPPQQPAPGGGEVPEPGAVPTETTPAELKKV